MFSEAINVLLYLLALEPGVGNDPEENQML